MSTNQPPKDQTSEVLHVKPLEWYHHFADRAISILMLIVSGTSKEAPQGTHFWNNKKLKLEEVNQLNNAKMVSCNGIPHSRPRWFWKIPIFHLPIVGGWRNYVVLEPEGLQKGETWHVGWITNDVVGVSQVKIEDKVRTLIGPGNVTFFGVESKSGRQLRLKQIGTGKIGSGGEFARVPLL